MSSELSQAGDLELGYDGLFEKRWHTFETLLRIFMILLIVLGIAGFFGRGYFSQATAHSPSQKIFVRYERILRFRTPTLLKMDLRPEASQGGIIRVELRGKSMDALQIQRIVPKPILEEPLAQGVRYTFQTNSVSSTRIILTQEPGKIGPVQGEIVVEQDAPLSLHQWIVP